MFVTEQELKNRFTTMKINNAVIKHIEIEILGHFGNLVSLDMPINFNGNHYAAPFNLINLTEHCGKVIRTLIELIDIRSDNNIVLSHLKDLPCRVVVTEKGVEAIGNIVQDKFIVVDDIKDFLCNL